MLVRLCFLFLDEVAPILGGILGGLIGHMLAEDFFYLSSFSKFMYHV